MNAQLQFDVLLRCDVELLGEVLPDISQQVELVRALIKAKVGRTCYAHTGTVLMEVSTTVGKPSKNRKQKPPLESPLAK